MAILDQLQEDVKTALKGGDKQRVGILRMLVSELQKDAKEGKGDELAVLRRERKRRLESASAFREGNRDDLAIVEEAEAEVVSDYMPAELTDEALREIVSAAITETDATSPKDMGQVMQAAMAKTAGQADGKRVSALVRELLGG